MTLTLILAIAALAACVLCATAHTVAVAEPAPLSADDTQRLPMIPPPPAVSDEPTPPAEWQVATVSTLSEAEDLLDLLEARGFADREFFVMGNSTFAVRWR